MENAVIEKRLTNYYDAFNAKKWNDVEEFLSDDFSYFTDNCTVHNKSSFMSFMRSDDWQGIDFRLEELEIKMSASNDLAFATYSTQFEGTSGETKMKFQAIETIVFKLEEGEWKILHFHTSNKN